MFGEWGGSLPLCNRPLLPCLRRTSLYRAEEIQALDSDARVEKIG